MTLRDALNDFAAAIALLIFLWILFVVAYVFGG